MNIKAYPCTVSGTTLKVRMPADVDILMFANQSGTINCHAIDHGSSSVDRTFLYLQKGDNVPAGAVYLGSVKMPGWRHIFKKA
jgi:hypothetical protein